MPLAAVYDIIKKAVASQSSPLLPVYRGASSSRFVQVDQSFFKYEPQYIHPKDVNDELLAFFSLVLSYAKNADQVPSGSSPKTLTSIMPRTDFVTIFNQVKGDIMDERDWDDTCGGPNALYDIFSVLACYRNGGE
jgi:hypothetical protein